MKTIIWALTFLSIQVVAEEYKVPKVKKLHWEKQKKTKIKSEKWISDNSIKEFKNPHDADQAGDNPQRKPSSGDESAKPRFWDFKVVK